ncbi:hypothetical protein [Rhizobium esperanzae]|uniref:Uncharacterized protein n=1 Tax=Rhizobium esperanzae TaxID=1967781 RepID=A0A7W6W7L9_9HYPH|nr:hypothetical protein [Rhizobium esperanzae]MBB4238949.1 hypothetical protein [Rhizobium esperanzae]
MRYGTIEQNSRLLISFGLLAIAAFLSVQNFEMARIEWIYTTDLSADTSDDLYYVFLCVMGLVLLQIGNTRRYWTWSLTAYFAWWSYSEIRVYLEGGFHGYGPGGCLDCSELTIKLYAPLGLSPLPVAALQFTGPFGSVANLMRGVLYQVRPSCWFGFTHCWRSGCSC